ncbi:MAG: hypothetical protein WAV45_09865 [Propionibacteriaceae bacterium]|nr:hypothetical protein [Micropruina sp.]
MDASRSFSSRPRETGGIFAYSDERQRVFARFGRPPLASIPLVLDHNLCNTRQIAQSFVPLAPASMVLRGGDGPAVEFVPTALDDVVDAADDQVERLLDEGWEPKDVALITVGAQHPVQKERHESLGYETYWDEFWSNDDVFRTRCRVTPSRGPRPSDLNVWRINIT